MKISRLSLIIGMAAATLLCNGCALFQRAPTTFEAEVTAVNKDLRYVTLQTDQVLRLREDSRYTVRRLSDDVELADLVIKSVNRKVLLADVLWSGWEPTYGTDVKIVLTYVKD